MSFTNVPASAEVRQAERADKVERYSLAIGSAVGAVYLLTRAARAARKGDYAKATYYAALWAGFTNNSHQNVSAYLRKTGRSSFNLK